MPQPDSLGRRCRIAEMAREIGVKYGTLYQAIVGKSWSEIEASGHG